MQLSAWIKGKIPTFVSAGAALVVCMLFPNAYAASEDDRMLSFSLSSAAVMLHEPIYLDLSVKNTQAGPIQLDLGFNRKGNLTFDIVEPSGAVLHTLKLAGEGFGRVGRITVGPGKTYKQRFLLNEWHPFSALGHYKLTPRLDTAITLKSGAAVPMNAPGTFTISVLPRDEARLKKVCEELAQRTLSSGNASDTSDSALALSFVADPVAVPYLAKLLDESANVSGIAIEGLRRIADQEAINVLIAHLNKPRNLEVSSAVVYALKQVGGATKDLKLKNLIETELRKAGR